MTLLYVLITLIFFAPLIPKLSTSIIGPPEDNRQFLWCMWYMKTALTNHLPLTYTDFIFYPEGHSLLFHTVSWYNAFLSVPLQYIFNLPLTYNLLMMLTFVISGLGAYLLCNYFTKSKILSFIGGYIYAFSPYHFAHSLHHFNISSMQFIPLFVLFYFKALYEKRIKYMVLAVLFFVLSSLSSWYYLMILGIFVLIESTIHLAINRSISRNRLIRAFLIIILTLTVLLPLVYPMAVTYLRHKDALEYQMPGHDKSIADLLGFITPQEPLLLAKFLKPGFDIDGPGKYSNPVETQVFLGYTNILLFLYLLIVKFKENRKIIFLFSSFLILAMGIYLTVNGKSYLQIKLPYYILYKLPFTNLPSCPGTMIVMSYLFLSIISAKAIEELGLRFQGIALFKRNRINKNLLALLLFVPIFVEFYSTTDESVSYRLPAIYECLKEAKRGAILQVPYKYSLADPILYLANQSYMLEQTIHHRKILTAVLSRKFKQTLRDTLSFDDMGSFKKKLVNNNVKYIIVYKDYTDKEKIDALNRLFKKIAEDKANIAYKVMD